MKKRLLAIFLITVFLLFVFQQTILESAASFLIVKDKPKKSDLILVLSGDSNGERMRQGAELYKKGYGKHLLVSGGQLYLDTTYADIMRKHGKRLGVPASNILIEDKSESTYENAIFSLPIVKKHGFKSIILVTSPTHSRRAKRVFKRIFKGSGIIISSFPVEKSKFKVKKWWKRHEDSQRVISEYVKLVGYIVKGW